MPVVDTSFLIDVEHRQADALGLFDRLVESDQPLLVPAIVGLEFASGGKDPKRVWARLREAYTIIDFTARIAERASVLANDAFRRGHFPGWSDVQIAATALDMEETLVTANGPSFSRFRGLKLLGYRGPA